MTISKSDYMLFLKHPAWLWLKKYDKSKLPEPSEGLQARFDEGNLFEQYVEKIFPGAVKLGYKTDGEFDGNKYSLLPALTKKEIEKNTGVIFQGRIEIDNLTCIFDILQRVEKNTFDLYEIKSSTSVKPEYIPDLAFQTVVLEKSGLTIRNQYVIHVNNEYVRNGEIDPKQLASEKEDVTQDVRACMDEMIDNIERAFEILSKKIMPDVSPRHLKQGSMEEWIQIFEAVKGKLPEYSLYRLCSLNAKKVGLLEDLGVELMEDIPDDFELSERQQSQVSAVKQGKQIINRKGIKEFLDKFKYPLYFFDYETLSGVIPAFDGIRPYQQVPFQYSLHILGSPDGEIEHREYLHMTNTNPCEPLLRQLKNDIGSDGTILVWHEGFEKGRNKELAEMFPKYEAFLLDLNDRMMDLKIPFSEEWFVDKDFFGSASITDVQPVLVPGPGYKGLEISNGTMAQRIWMETFLSGKNADKKDKIIKDLLAYCNDDTLNMYKILKHLYKVII